MFERFTGTARRVVVQAQEDARRLGHNYIGCEHLLLAAAAAGEPAGMVLRDHGVTPERVEAEIVRTVGRGRTADPPGRLDREALAFIGIDLDVVRARIEAAFGPDALTRGLPATRRRRRPAWGKGPLAELTRRRRHRRARRDAAAPAGRSGNVSLNTLRKGQIRKGTVSSIVNFGAFVDLGGVDGLLHVSELSWKHIGHPGEVVEVGQEVTVEVLDVDMDRERVSLSLKSTQEDPWQPGRVTKHEPGPAPRGHIPFTPRAKKSLYLALRESEALHDNYIGVQHITLALLGLKDGTVPMILSALGAPSASLRAAVLARYRKAS